MALVLKDRVKETNSATGTSDFALTGAVAGFRSFADIGNANTTYYLAHDTTANTWEAGIGTYTASGTTLSRDTVLNNSSGGTSKISFANAPVVWCNVPAAKIIYKDGDGNAMGPRFFVKNASDQTGATNDAYTKITYGTEVSDTHAAYGSNKFTVPTGWAGKYRFIFRNGVQSPGGVSLYRVGGGLYVNGTKVFNGYNQEEAGSSAYTEYLAEVWLNLAEGDYVEHFGYGWQASGTLTFPSNSNFYCSFSGEWVAP